MTEALRTRLAKGVIFVLFFAAGVAGLLLGNPSHRLQATADEACHARCADALKFHRLVGKRDGPWTCECY